MENIEKSVLKQDESIVKIGNKECYDYVTFVMSRILLENYNSITLLARGMNISNAICTADILRTKMLKTCKFDTDFYCEMLDDRHIPCIKINISVNGARREI